jgi:hypothetical protein
MESLRKEDRVAKILLSVLGAIGLAGLMVYGWQLEKHQWIPVTAYLHTHQIFEGQQGGRHELDVQFTYRFNQRTWTATDTLDDLNYSGDVGTLRKWVREHPPGTEMTAFINPDDHSEVTLIRNTPIWILLFMGFAGLLLIVPVLKIDLRK